MLIFNLSFLSYREWRVSHAMSHHLYTNSFHDLEISMFEPFFVWLPQPNMKNFIQRYLSWFYGPLIYCILYIMEFVRRIYSALSSDKKNFYIEDFIPFLIPISMYFFGNQNFGIVVTMWLYIIIVASFLFGLIGLNAAHHHPEIVHDGDTLRFVQTYFTKHILIYLIPIKEMDSIGEYMNLILLWNVKI